MVLFGVVPLVVVVFAVVGAAIGAFVAGIAQAFGDAFGYPSGSIVLGVVVGAVVFGYLAWLAYDPIHLWPGIAIVAALYVILLAVESFIWWRYSRKLRK